MDPHGAQALIDRTEERRRAISDQLDPKHRGRLGQFFTPAPVADFLADLLDLPDEGQVTLLDPGAGIGSLSAAVVARVVSERPQLELRVVAFEVDDALEDAAGETLADCERVAAAAGVSVVTELRTVDFIAWASAELAGGVFSRGERFSACVMNPPYRKINTASTDRLALERVGIRASNLYAAFLALGAELLEPAGQLSAITPRSFANGPYFRPFREYFLDRVSIDRLHVYEKRGRVFSDADVLQENVVLKASRQDQTDTIDLSTSAGYDDPPAHRLTAASSVLHPGDPHRFVHIPVDEDDTIVAEQIANLPSTLADLDISVSTGRVVDFRARDHLVDDPDVGTVPLIYPTHLRGGFIEWPQLDGRKPNALEAVDATQALLLPAGNYVLVKRFTAKEEPRRVVAGVARPADLPGEDWAFENHLNVYHWQNEGISADTALGLSLYLNSTTVDTYVRQFSGHTQINATDLRLLRYPSRETLDALGAAAASDWPATQSSVDALVAAHVDGFGAAGRAESALAVMS